MLLRKATQQHQQEEEAKPQPLTEDAEERIRGLAEGLSAGQWKRKLPHLRLSGAELSMAQSLLVEKEKEEKKAARRDTLRVKYGKLSSQGLEVMMWTLKEEDVLEREVASEVKRSRRPRPRPRSRRRWVVS